MDAMLEELRAKGVEITGALNTRWGARGDGRSLFIRAPEGNRVEIKCYKGW